MPHFGVAEFLIIVVLVVFIATPGLLVVWAVRTGKLANFLASAFGSQPKPPSQPTTPPPKETPAEKLEQLKQMLDAGLISAQDYEAKKADILSRM